MFALPAEGILSMQLLIEGIQSEAKDGLGTIIPQLGLSDGEVAPVEPNIVRLPRWTTIKLQRPISR